MLAQNTYLHHLVALFVIYTQVHHHEQVRKTEIEKAIRSLVEEFDQAQVNQVAPAWETSAGVTKFPSIVRQFFQDYRVSQAGVALHKYLLALQNSGRLPATVKNYRSDIGQFLNFAPAKSPDQLVQKAEVARFLEFEQQRGSSQATIHRKVASLSQFFQWLQENGWLTTNLWKSFSSTSFSELLKTDKPVRELTTLSDQTDERPAAWSLPLKNIDIQAYLPQQFQNSLARAVKKTPVLTRLRKAISAQPLLGYFNLAMGIIFFLGAGFLGYRQFFSETSSSLAFPTSLTRPNRSLSFQGRLTSATRSPITSITPMRFKLYDSGPATGSGNLLWDSNSCNIDPDQDGIFSTTLGDACGTEITSDVFTEHSNVWLEVQVNSEILAPRQSIKTVAYALNSETLQGYPASASAVENTVVIMRNDGKVVFGNANPILEATGDSFTLTANTLTLETSSGSNGDVIINPDGTGQTLINSNTIIDGYLYAPGATLSATYAGGTALTLKAGPTATGDIMQWQSSAGSPLGVIDKSGNIGIGTTVARASLEIAGTASSSGTLTFKGTTDPKIDILNGESFGLRTSVGGDVGLTERLTILNNGNIGIGSTTPSQVLDVVGGIRLGAADAENVLNTSTAGGAPSGSLYWGDRTVCDSTGNCSAVDSNWSIAGGSIYPKNTTLDMFIGGTASSSAKFAFLNVNSGIPTASIAGNLALAAPTGADPATKLNVYNGGSFGLRTSVGGDAGLTERLTILNNGNVGIGTTSPTAKVAIKDTSSLATLSTEMITNADDRTFASDLSHWSGTNWSIGSGVATHVAGANTYSLPNIYLTADPVAGEVYRVVFTVNTTTAGTIRPAIGGSLVTQKVGQVVGTQYLTQYIVAGNTNPLTFTPDATWAGSIDNISVKQVTASSKALALAASDGDTAPVEFRMGYDNSKNIFIGTGAGKYAHTYNSSENIAIGHSVLQYSGGSNDTAIGDYSMEYSVDTGQTTAIGHKSLRELVYGYVNTSVGEYSMANLVDGSYNTTVGAGAGAGGSDYTGASYNTLLGYRTAYNISSGASNNLVVGNKAGYNLGSATGNIFLGNEAGYNETTSNKLYIDNSNASSPLIWGDFASNYININGNLGIGSTAPSQKLDVVGGIRLGAADAENVLNTSTAGGAPSGALYWGDRTVCDSTGNCSTVDSNWTVGSGIIYPKNATLDMFIGGTASASAKFAFLNVNSGIPTASIAGNLALATPTGADPATKLNVYNGGSYGIQTSVGGDVGLAERLTILNNGNVGIGSTAPASLLDVAGAGLINSLTLDGNTGTALTVSGTSFGTDLSLQNGETLDNDTDNTVNLGFGAANGILKLTSATEAFLTSSVALNIDSATTNALNIGTGANAKTITLGNATTTTALALNSGTGDITLTSTDQIKLNSSKAAGGTTTEALSLKSTVDLGAADEVLQIGDSAGDFFTMLGNGNVGIGSTAPSQVLDVVGGIRLGAADAENVLHTTVAGGAPSGNLYWGDRTLCDSTGNCGGGGSNWTLGAGFIHPINPSVDLFIGGTASASAKFAFLNVNSGIPTASIAGNLALAAPTGADPATKLNVYNGGSFGIKTSVGGDVGLTEKLTVLNNGNVGIGSTAPANSLDVTGDIGLRSGKILRLYTSGDTNYNVIYSTAANLYMNSGNGEVITQAVSNIDFQTWTASSYNSKMTITNAGNVGIGTTGPLKTLDIRGSATISGTLQLAPNVPVDAGTCNAGAKGTQYYNGTDNKMYYCNGTAWTVMGAGDVKLETFTGDGTYTPTSDTVLTIVEAIGPGGGGGGGGSIATGTARTGGGGGGGGAYTTKTFSAANVTPNVSIVVPTGGVGGNGGTNAAGSDGAAASADTSFGSLLVAYKGGGGGNGTVTTTLAGGGGGGGSGAAGTSSTNQTGQAGGGPGGGAAAGSVDGMGGGGGGTTAAGGNSSWGGGGGGPTAAGGTAGYAGGSSVRGGGGGGGGGSCAASCTNTNGGAGGNVPGATAGGGGAAGTGGGAGGNGTDNATGIGGDGGGGGGSNQTAGSNGGAGGNGGAPGGGGGGGGAATYSAPNGTGGKGGDGGRGEVRVWSVKGSGADYAELYSSHDVTLEPGDVVALDSSLKAGVKKSTSPYENGLLGIISTLPGQVVGSVDDQAEKVVIVALAGRVPTKVSTENGPIKAGDFLTASSIPGVAMKATSVGLTVGTAIEDYNGAVGEVGNISVFVNTTYTSGLLLKQVLASHGVEIPESVWRSNTIDYSWYVLATMLEKQEEIKNKPILTETYVDRLVAGLELITPRLVTQSTYTNEVRALPGSDLNFYLPETSKLSIRKEQIEGSPPDLTELFSFDSGGNASVSGTLIAQSLRAETIDGLLFNSSGELLLNKSDEDFQVTPIGGSALTKVIGAAKAVIGRIQAGAINAQELLVSGQAYINNLSVNDFSINGQSLREYVVSIIAEVSPTPAPTGAASGSAWLAEVFQQDQDTGQPIVENLNVIDTLSVNTISSASISAQSLQVSGETKLSSLLVSQNASVAGVFTTNELDANSARIDALEVGMAQLDSVKATTAEFAQATISGTLYAKTIADLDKQIAELLGQPALMDVITGNIPSPQDDFTSLYQVLGSISSTASQAGQLNQSVADLNLAGDDVVLDASAGFIDRYFKVNGVAYVGDSLGVGNTLRVGQKLELTDTYLSFSTGADTPDESPIFFIQPSGKGLLALMGGLMTLDETGQVTINGNLHVAGDVSVEGSLLANVIEPLNQGESLKLNLGPSNTGLEATMAGTLASPSGQLEVLGDAGTPVATVSAQGKASFSSLSLGRDLLARPSVAGAATESSQLTQEATQTTGRATLPAGNRDLIIRNPYVRRDSLIYLTPLNSTNNQVLYVNHIEAPADETIAQASDERSFTVSLDNVTASDISFTWWIVN